MRALTLIILAVTVVACARAETAAQKAFRSLVADASRVEVSRTATREKPAALILSTSDQKEIAAIKGVFAIKDPAQEKSSDGEEIITLPCFCAPEYIITFWNPSGGELRFGLKHSLSAVLPPQPLGTDYLTDYLLSERSTKRLKKMITRWEKAHRALIGTD